MKVSRLSANATSKIYELSHLFSGSVTAALAGFLFGFDTVVISALNRKFSRFGGWCAGIHGIAMASALYGTVLVPCLVADRLTGLDARPHCYQLEFFIWSAQSGQASPRMSILSSLRESSAALASVFQPWPRSTLHLRDRTTQTTADAWPAWFQFNIVFGILIAFASNYLLRNTVKMPGVDARVAAFPVVLYTMFCFGIHGSPLACWQERRPCGWLEYPPNHRT